MGNGRAFANTLTLWNIQRKYDSTWIELSFEANCLSKKNKCMEKLDSLLFTLLNSMVYGAPILVMILQATLWTCERHKVFDYFLIKMTWVHKKGFV